MSKPYFLPRSALCMLGIELAACGAVSTLDPSPGGDDDTAPAVEPQQLTVTIVGDGAVSSDVAGIQCGATCTATFPAGAQITLTPTPAAGATLVSWSGACTGAAACTVAMDAAQTVTAKFAPRGSLHWVQQVTVSMDPGPSDVVVDARGDVIVTGVVHGVVATTDLVVTKYAHDDGHVLWTQRFDTRTEEVLGGLAVDADGEIYISLKIRGGGMFATFGTETFPGDVAGNLVVMRLAAATGEVVWANDWGGTAEDTAVALAVSGVDLFVIGDTASPEARFDQLSLRVPAATRTHFVVRASTFTGTAITLKELPGDFELHAVAVNGDHVAIAGGVRSSFVIDAPCSATQTTHGLDAVLLDLRAADLDCQWSRTFGDSALNTRALLDDVAALPDGGWIVVGDFQGSIALPPSGGILTSRGSTDVVAGRYSASGDHVWSFRYGDTGRDEPTSVAVAPDGSVLFTGSYSTAITLGTFTLGTQTSNRAAFATRMSPGIAPVHDWAVSLGSNSDEPTSIAAAADGTAHVLARFFNTTNVGGTPLTTTTVGSWLATLVR